MWCVIRMFLIAFGLFWIWGASNEEEMPKVLALFGFGWLVLAFVLWSIFAEEQEKRELRSPE